MRRRAVARDDDFPEWLAVFDWRDWRPPAKPDDPSPWYDTWYMGLVDWNAAREAWAAERGASARLLPRTVRPPSGDLFASTGRWPAESPPANRVPAVHRAKPRKRH